METLDNFDLTEKVSYLQARDPSILSWNRHGIVRHNLAKEFECESTILSEKEDNHIKVYLRIKDGEEYKNLYSVEDDTLTCMVPQGSHSARNNRDNQDVLKKYKFSEIFGPETSQQELFDKVIKGKILNFINGYNNTLLAYGASGAGKTFTMVGTADHPGIIPRALEYLFRTLPDMNDTPEVKPLPNGKVVLLHEAQGWEEIQSLENILPQSCSEKHIKTYRAMQQRLSKDPVATIESSPPILGVYVSFAEIYNEFVYDLIQPTPLRGQQRPKLKVGGYQDQIYIKGLKYLYVRSGLEAYQVLQYGINNLKYANTAINLHSSRSHCIFTIRLVQGYDIENSHVSLFNFCDLAGSERLKKTMNVGDRLKESNNINSSLLVLGRCISNIRDGQYKKENKLPPFRESKLTQIFQRALMGKEDIVMIVNINPSISMFDESQHTLNFAAIAKEIMVEEPVLIPLKPNRFTSCLQKTEMMPYINEDERDKEVEELRNEIANLTLEISELRQEKEADIEAERQHLRGLYEQLIAIKDSQMEKLQRENKKLLQENKQLLQEARRDDVIVLSDDDSDGESEQMLNLRKEIHKFKTEIYNMKEMERDMKQNNKVNNSKISRLEGELENAKRTIEDAKSDYKAMLKENEKLRKENQELTIDLCKIEDEYMMQKLELETLRNTKTYDKENIETLEDEIKVLRQSICNVQSPMSPRPNNRNTIHDVEFKPFENFRL